MKLALLTDRPQSNFGAEQNLIVLGVLARELGHDVTAVTIEPGLFLDDAADHGLSPMLVALPPALTPVTRGGLRRTPATMWRLARFGHQIHRRMRAAGVEAVVVSSMRAAAMTWAARLRAPRMLWYIQMLTRPSVGAGFAAIASSRIAVIAPGVEASIPRPVLALVRSRLAELPPCRDLSAFTANGRHHRAVDDPLEVVTVGKVTPRKHVHDLVEAAGRARSRGAEVRLTVVGHPSGPEDNAYCDATRARADAIEVPVTWAGWTHAVAPRLQQADVFALVSEREGLPGAAIEAMAAGLPLLVSDTGPIARLVEQSDCGRVAGVGDVEALADHLVAMAADPQRARDQGANAVAAAGRFTPAATSEAIDAILSAMTHPGRAPGLTTDPARS